MTDKKSIIIYLLIIFIICLLIIMPFDLKKEKKDDTEKTVYGIVKENNKSFVVLEDTESKEKVYVKRTMNVAEGDIVALRYVDDINNCEYEVIANKNDITEPSQNEEKITTTTTTSTTTTTAAKKSSKKNKKTTTTMKTTTTTSTTKSTTTEKAKNENDLLKKIKEYVDNAIKGGKEKTKETFIKLVDFIFYDGELFGYKYKNLSQSAKEKVLYYAIELDGYIDKKWPGYKETISSKYNDIKQKLFYNFMNTASNVCMKYPSQCVTAIEDFAKIKDAYDISWDFIKGVYNKYVKPTGQNLISTLTSWYEIYSGKA